MDNFPGERLLFFLLVLLILPFAAQATDYDFGDAPDPNYPTLIASDGAKHDITSLFLDATVDADTDGQPDSAAIGDDTDGADNEDGDWIDPDEQIFTNQDVVGGVNNLNFNVPVGAVTGTTFARFRISTAGSLSYTDQAADGEVEDYAVTIIDGTAPTLTSFERKNPTDETTNADILVFRATFDEAVQNVDNDDFAVTGATDAVISVAVNTSNTVFDLTVSGGDLAVFNGTVGINLFSEQDITDLADNELPGAEPDTDESYNVDNIAPVFSSVDDNGGDNSYRAGEAITFDVDLGEPNLTVTADLSVINSSFSSTHPLADDGDNTYSFTTIDVDDGGNLQEGTAVAVTFSATDGAENGPVTDNSLTLVLDKTEPQAPGEPDLDSGSDTGYDTSDNYTSDTTPTFTGTAEADATVTLINNAVETIGNTTADDSGNWTITAGTLSEAGHTITVKVTDAAGNISAESSGLSVTIDTSVAVPSTPDMTADSDTGGSDSDNYTSDNSPTFTGTAEMYSLVTLTTNAEINPASAYADVGGKWTIIYSDIQPLAEGSHTITATAEDMAGNTSTASSGLSVTIDTSGPTVNIYSPADEAADVAVDANLVLTFNETVQKGAGTIVIKKTIDESVFATIEVTSEQVTLSDDTVTIDPVGNFDSGVSYYIVIDTGAIEDVAYNDYAGINDQTTWNFTTVSNNSDIIADTTFTYTTDIAYNAYQSDDITSANSVEVGRFTIHDGGESTNDADSVGTLLTDLTFSVTNWSNLRRLAVYDGAGTSEIQEAAVNDSTVSFTGMSGLTAADDGSLNFVLRATFNDSVTDNQQLQLTITAATTDGIGSGFAATNAGGAATSTTGDENRIEVTASQIVFISQPQAEIYVEVRFSLAPELEAWDVLDNLDLDFNYEITASSNSSDLSTTGDPTGESCSSGMCGFYDLFKFTQPGGPTTLQLTAGGITSAASDGITVIVSNNSDIIADETFSYASNIAYNLYQSTDITIANSVEVGRFTVRDGGGTADDDDGAETYLDDITFNVTNGSNLRQLAVYDPEGGEISEISVTGTSAEFSNLNVYASDNETRNFTLRATFQSNVTDNQQLEFKITAATDEFDDSGFAATDAGGAITSTVGDNNRIEVTATQLIFTTPPPATADINSDLTATPVLAAQDTNDNTDLDFIGDITSSSNSSGLTTTNDPEGAFSDGAFTYPANFQFTQIGGPTNLQLTAGGISGMSSDITVSDLTPPTVNTYTPADEAADVAVDADLVLTFNETVQKGAGAIVIKKTIDESVFATIEVTSEQVTSSDDTVTIDPLISFDSDTGYYVEIDTGAIEDVAYNDYAGINDKTTWNFTTVNLAPTIEISEPDGVDDTADLTFNIIWTDSDPDDDAQISLFYYSSNTTSSYGDTWRAKDSSRYWESVAMSSDGAIQTAVVNGGLIYVSTDSGDTWSAKDTDRSWESVAMSADGAIQTAVVFGGQIYVSTDSGENWSPKENSDGAWYSVAMSADGTIQTAVAFFDKPYVSTDSGENWSAKDIDRFWRSVTMSADGAIQTAVGINGQIYVSTDSGETWSAKDSDRTWQSVAMSADGSIQTAVVDNGQIYVSTDSGENWSPKDTDRRWSSVAMSADGTIQTAVVVIGQIYVSKPNGTLIASGISEDDETDFHSWDTSAITEGDYYIYAVIDDGTNSTVTDYSDGTVTITHDTTAPTLTAFERQEPTDEITNADSLVFIATFNENVQNVDNDDFAVTGVTDAVISVDVDTASAVFVLTVSGGGLASFNGIVGIDLDGNQDITDLADNKLPNTEPATDETYTVDNTAPILSSFTRQTEAANPTNADTLVFQATFDEDVQNVDNDDFAVTGATDAVISVVEVTANTVFDLTVSGGNLASFSGTVGINLAGGQNITDPAGNDLPTGKPTTDETYTVDHEAPGLTSFKRQDPTEETTNADTLTFRATFNEEVYNINPVDFDVNGETTATVTAVSMHSSNEFDLTVNGGNLAGFNGTVGINLADGQDITDSVDNALPNTEPDTDETYIVVNADNEAPTVDTFTPADETTGVAVDANLSLIFNETVQKGAGNIVIRRTSDDATFETIDVASVQVTLTTTTETTDTVTIDPTADFDASTAYYVEIASGAIKDGAYNGYTGINDTTTWNFETGEADSFPWILFMPAILSVK